MGVPSFYRWLAERYPLVVEQLPDAGCSSRPDAHGGAGGVDNLYIDMNGVIHPCFHPEGGAQPKSEREVFEAILKDNKLFAKKVHELVKRRTQENDFVKAYI